MPVSCFVYGTGYTPRKQLLSAVNSCDTIIIDRVNVTPIRELVGISKPSVRLSFLDERLPDSEKLKKPLTKKTKCDKMVSV